MLKHMRKVSLYMAVLALAFVVCLIYQPQSVSHARSLAILDGSPSQESVGDSPSQESVGDSPSQESASDSPFQESVGGSSSQESTTGSSSQESVPTQSVP
jgi:hypothetical protein